MFQLGDMIEHEAYGLGIVISTWNNLDKNEWITVEYFNGHTSSFPNKPFATLKKVS